MVYKFNGELLTLKRIIGHNGPSICELEDVMSVQSAIEAKLQQALNPAHMQVINESFRHSVPPGSESHFKVTLVADEFAGQSPVKRHQMVYRLLDEELKGGVHALALHLYTAAEWHDKGQAAPDSPNCRGGSK